MLPGRAALVPLASVSLNGHKLAANGSGTVSLPLPRMWLVRRGRVTRAATVFPVSPFFGFSRGEITS
jgi:hypothetical protein